MSERKREEETASWDAREVRRSQAEHQQTARPARRKRRRINPILYLLCVLVVSAILAGGGWILACDLCAFNKPYAETTVEIAENDDLGTVADKLHEAGLIKYKWFFRLFGAVANADEKIGAGTYSLNTDMDYRALITGMRSRGGSAETVWVTIPEGYTVAQTIRLLAENGVNTEENLLEAAKTHDFAFDFIDNNSEDITRLEGYLFPDTYEFFKPERASDALNRLLLNFNNKLDEERQALIDASGRSLDEIITIASLIEKETDGTDQANIASVIYNRLNGPGDKGGTYGMLQIDASLLYGLPNHQGPITRSDMEADTPYNLYKNPGLPPTPIANPGDAAIEAALQPAKTDYYYYALGTDNRHRFFTNYGDHSAFVSSGAYGG